jgi:hypothetical protein
MPNDFNKQNFEKKSYGLLYTGLEKQLPTFILKKLFKKVALCVSAYGAVYGEYA